MEAYIIDLDHFRPDNSRVLSSRPWGVAARDRSGIDEALESDKIIEIHIPSDIVGITPSYLQEFLENAVVKLGSHNFSNRVRFISGGKYQIEHDLDEAMSRILKAENTFAY